MAREGETERKRKRGQRGREEEERWLERLGREKEKKRGRYISGR